MIGRLNGEIPCGDVWRRATLRNDPVEVQEMFGYISQANEYQVLAVSHSCTHGVFELLLRGLLPMCPVRMRPSYPNGSRGCVAKRGKHSHL